MAPRTERSRSSRSRSKAATSSAAWRTPPGTSTVGRGSMAGSSLRQEGKRTVVGWIRDRFPTTPWVDLTRKAIETDQRQMPRSHAEKYELKTIWYWYPLYCLGGISFVAFIILTITGILLGFYYIPDGTIEFTRTGDVTSAAYESMNFIMNDVPFGFMIRGLHHWAAHVMIAAVFLHMMRVYFTGAYKKPRELNWILGVVLLLVTLFFGYSGYLLPGNDLSGGGGAIGT